MFVATKIILVAAPANDKRGLGLLPGACNTHSSKVAPWLMRLTEKVLTSSTTAVMLTTPSFHTRQHQLCLMMMMVMMMMMVVVVVQKMMMTMKGTALSRLMLEPDAWPADRSPLQVSY